jgi:hypothetical protein
VIGAYQPVWCARSTRNGPFMRTPSQKAKPDPNLQTVIQATQKLWCRHHLTYDQTRYVAKQVRRVLELERPQIRTRVMERLSRDEERRSSTPPTG